MPSARTNITTRRARQPCTTASTSPNARKHLRDFLAALLAEGVEAGQIRADVAPAELAEYCLHALSAAGTLPSKAAVARLTKVIETGLAPG